MKRRTPLFGSAVRGFALLVPAVALAGCASDPVSPPVITSLSPSSATAGGPSFTLKVIGTRFQSTDVVLWNGAALATQPVSSTELDAQVPSTLIRSAAIVASAAQLVSGTRTQSQPTAGQAAADAAVAINVVQKPPGSLESNTATFTITSSTAVPDFSIAASPSSQTVTAGGGTTYTATVSALNGFTGPVSLSVGGLPIGASGSFSPTSVAGSGTSTLTVTTASSTTPPGTYTLTITGTSGTLTRSRTVSLVVNAAVMPGVIQQITNSTTGENFRPFVDGDPLVSFTSTATDLVPNDTNGKPDVFVACVAGGGVTSCPTPITRVSLTSSGGQIPAGTDAGPAPTQGFVDTAPISGDGRFVAFVSSDPNVVAPPTPQGALQVYERDTCFGASACAPTTFLASVTSTGVPAGGKDPSISANGRVVSFQSGFQISARDTCFGAPTGCAARTVLVSADNTGAAGNIFSDNPSASGDGRFVAFESNSNNLVPTASSILQQIFLRDTCIGAPAGCAPATTLISVNSSGSPSNSFSQSPSVSGDGRFVVFFSQSSDILPGNTAPGRPDVFLRDTCGGSGGPVAGCTPSTTRVSVALDGTQANAASITGGAGASISTTGRFIAFGSGATNLLPTPSTAGQVYVLDTCFGAPTGCTRALHKVTVDTNGNEVGSSGQFALSGDGKFLAFTKLVGTAPNQIQQIFLALTGF